METLDIGRVGYCSQCKLWFPLKGRTLPEHYKMDGSKCSSSGYGAINYKYVIADKKQAIEVSHFLIENIGKCLWGSDRHSGACGDGDLCNRSWFGLSSALAEFYLKDLEKIEEGKEGEKESEPKVEKSA